MLETIDSFINLSMGVLIGLGLTLMCFVTALVILLTIELMLRTVRRMRDVDYVDKVGEVSTVNFDLKDRF